MFGNGVAVTEGLGALTPGVARLDNAVPEWLVMEWNVTVRPDAVAQSRSRNLRWRMVWLGDAVKERQRPD